MDENKSFPYAKVIYYCYPGQKYCGTKHVMHQFNLDNVVFSIQQERQILIVMKYKSVT